jgi:Transcription elongation factor, GreA/GreB, C-term
MSTFKTALHRACLTRVAQSIAAAQTAMDEAQAAANQETKSSAGDKYETGRAMMQLEKEKYALQRQQAEENYRQLELLDPAQSNEYIRPGSLIQTTEGLFYLCVSLGKLAVEGKTVFVLSPQSPLGEALLGKKTGEQVSFRGKEVTIQAVE